jgi:hypothetical protein
MTKETLELQSPPSQDIHWYQCMEAYLRANIICYGLESFATDYPVWMKDSVDPVSHALAEIINSIRFKGLAEPDVVTITAGLSKFIKQMLIGKKGIYQALTYPLSSDNILFEAAALCDEVSFDSEAWWEIKEKFVGNLDDDMQKSATRIFERHYDWDKEAENFIRKSAHYFIRLMITLELGNITWHYNLQEAIDNFAWHQAAFEWNQKDNTASSVEEFNLMKWQKRQEVVQILVNYLSRRLKRDNQRSE